MGTPTIKRTGEGTIKAIRKICVDATSTKFAMVMPDDGCRTLAVRIGPNLTADGDDYFIVGDKVKYTVRMGPASGIPTAQDLVKLVTGAHSV